MDVRLSIFFIPFVMMLVTALGFAYAQPDNEALRLAHAVEVLGIRLEALMLEEGDAGEKSDAGEEEASLEPLFTLFAGSLEAQDPALVGELEALLVELETESQSDEAESDVVVQRALSLLEQAQTLLIPAEARTPTFQAALLTQLLAQEGGVSESYEKAAGGEAEAYILAWVALSRAKALWGGLEPTLGANEAQVAEINRAFGVLDDLIASPEPPERFRDPEDADGAVNDIAFSLEGATATSLLPRDLSQSVTGVREQLAAACGAAQAGEVRLALEHAAYAHVLYSEQLSATLSILEPELNTDLSAHLAGPFPQHIEAGANVGADCGLLRHALTQVGERVR